MIDLFMRFRTFLKFEDVCIDNNAFRMHYKITVIMLLVFTLMVTSKQFFGDPIHCIGSNEQHKEALNNYCWIYGTYTLKSTADDLKGKSRISPGVGPELKHDVHIKHTYYQWVSFVLLGQAVLFYTPRYLWKIWEGGRLKTLASDLSSPIVSKDWSEFRRGELVSYLTYTNIYTHNVYAMRYAICEILNLVNAVGQIFLLDLYLGGEFRNYGSAVASFTHTPRLPIGQEDYYSVNPMDLYFPKLTKCWFKTYGPSGTDQFKDLLCVLPLNIVNEKIFLILWFWLIILTLVSAAAVIFRIVVFSLPPLRTVMTMGHLRFVKRKVVTRVVRRLGFGDWFILYLLGKNMNPIIYKDLILELSKELEHKTVMV